MRLAQDTFNNVNVLRTKILFHHNCSYKLSKVLSAKTERYFDLMNLALSIDTRQNILYRKWRSVSEHMNKTWLSPIAVSYSAPPEFDLVGYPWFVTYVAFVCEATEEIRIKIF
jgi:hypothetical protein